MAFPATGVLRIAGPRETDRLAGWPWSPMMAYGVLVQLSLAVGDFLQRKAGSPAPTGLNPPESALHLEARLMQQSGKTSTFGSRFLSFSRGSFARRKQKQKQKQSRPKCRKTRAVGLAAGLRSVWPLSSHKLSWGQGFRIEIPRKSKAHHPQPGPSGKGVGAHFRQRGSLPGNLALGTWPRRHGRERLTVSRVSH